jgi:hypothetical protein
MVCSGTEKAGGAAGCSAAGTGHNEHVAETLTISLGLKIAGETTHRPAHFRNKRRAFGDSLRLALAE